MYVLDLLWCMTSQHGAIGLRTDCKVVSSPSKGEARWNMHEQAIAMRTDGGATELRRATSGGRELEQETQQYAERLLVAFVGRPKTSLLSSAPEHPAVRHHMPQEALAFAYWPRKV